MPNLTTEQRIASMYREHVTLRDDYMKRARRWKSMSLTDWDRAACQAQAMDFVRAARRYNHHALSLRLQLADIGLAPESFTITRGRLT